MSQLTKITTKLIAIVVVIALMFSYTGTTFATAKSDVSVGLQEKIQNEIEMEKQEVFQSVYEQLEKQHALSHLDIYKDILSESIESKIYAKYAAESPSRVTAGSTRYVFTYGGAMAYDKASGHVTTTYLDYDNSYYYVLSGGSCIAKTIIEAIAGSLPNWGYVFTALFALTTIVSNSAKTSIKNANGYAYIISVKGNDGSTSSVLLGWSSYPYVNEPSGSNLHTKFFAKHDPWKK